MSLLDTINGIEEELKTEKEPFPIVATDYFIYKYLPGISRIAYEGAEYLCFPRGFHLFGTVLSADEAVMCEDIYHVYNMSDNDTYVTDSALKDKIVKEYERRLLEADPANIRLIEDPVQDIEFFF